MFSRILRSLIALATIIVVYQAYVLLAVPWLEPPLAAWQAPRSTEIDRDQAADAPSKYQKLLANYFPPDHWSQTSPLKVMGNWPVLLVVDNYKRQENGWIEIYKFALLVFPTPVQEGLPPPRDAIILEAPRGARLQFDENFRPDRFQIGQIVQGRFPGRITIRSEMHEPGPADDLFLEASDLEMNSKLLYTQNPLGPVRFRLGPNVGGGSGLEIRFRDEKGADARKLAVNSLEIRRDVQLRVDLKTDSLLPTSASHALRSGSHALPASGSHALRGNPIPGRSRGLDATQSVAEVRSHAERGNEESHAERGNEGDERGNEADEAARPPVDVTCTGPFQFDFVRHVASFDQNVQVRQLDPNGPGDRLDAQQLDIHFAPKSLAAGAAAPPPSDAGGRMQTELRQLEPTLIVAQGLPVVIASPRHRAEARSQRVQLDLRQRRVTLDGGRDTTLVQGPNVLKAPTIEYWHPAGDAGTSIGRFRANGPGSLYYVLDPAKPDEVFQAAWQKSVELGRSQGQPMLALEGRPQLGVAGMGSLAADQLTIWFRELVDATPTASGLALNSRHPADKQSELIPDRLSATGQVEIASPRLSARVEQLLATFEVIAEPPAAAAAPGVAGQPPNIAAQLSPARRKQPTSAYHVEADRLQLGARLRGRDAAPATLECDGNVVLREIALVPSPQHPLELRGSKLTATGLDAGAARVKIIGASDARSQFVQFAGRGMTFRTAVVEIDQRENRMWSAGPGQATILIARDLAGRAVAAPTPFDIQWQEGMDFDGRQATFRGNILGQGADAALRCDRLIARLAAPIKFDAPSAGVEQNATDVAEIEFDGQVMISHRTRDEAGPTSHERLELARFSINQQTGVISGTGPGIIRSTRFGDQLGALTGLTAGRGSNPAPRAAAQKLNFLRIDFDGRLGGNLYLREIAFNRRVRTVYGPVDAWEQELDVKRPENLPPESFTLNCDELSANEDPVAARAAAGRDQDSGQLAPIQLSAKGNVQIAGQSATQGRFFATALSATYDQTKQMLSLNGDGRTDALVETQRRPGEPFRARLIQYSLATGLPKVDDFRGAIFTFPPESPPNPTTGQGPAGPRR